MSSFSVGPGDSCAIFLNQGSLNHPRARLTRAGGRPGLGGGGGEWMQNVCWGPQVHARILHYFFSTGVGEEGGGGVGGWGGGGEEKS